MKQGKKRWLAPGEPQAGLRKLRLVGAAVLALLLAGAGPSWGGPTATATVNVTAPLASSAQLTLSPTVINFPDANPGTAPIVPANENPVTVTASFQTGPNKTVTLTALAQGDLVSGGDTIAIGNVTWTGSGDGFNATGTMSKSSAQPVAQWTGPGTRTGSLSFFLKNSWSYATGNYRQGITFTLTAP